MPILGHDDLQRMIYEMFIKAGAPEEEAKIISDHLIEASLVGHDSHGVIRARGYALGMQRGVNPSTNYKVVKETPATAVIDAQGGLGIVAAQKAIDMAIQKAKICTFGAVGMHHVTHTGRIGAFPVRAAKEGLIGICLLNGGGQLMAPFGGTARRLPPNPLSVAIPRKDAEPLMLDMTTSVVAGGKVELKMARGEKLPEGWMIDKEGKAVTDPTTIWRNRDDSAILPLGGLQFGHKGFGLGIVVDVLAGGLSWAGCSQQKPTHGANGFLAMAIKIEDFIPLAEFVKEVEALVDWVKSSPKLPGVSQIYVPGEIEQVTKQKRLKEGIYIEDTTWKGLVEMASSLNVTVPEVK
jgi:uncharacterized oxidoreductase